MALIEAGMAAMGVDAAAGDDGDAAMEPAAAGSASAAPTPKRARMGLTPARMRAMAATPGSVARRAAIGGGSALSFDDGGAVGRASVAPGGGLPRAGATGASSSSSAAAIAVERENAALRDELVRGRWWQALPAAARGRRPSACAVGRHFVRCTLTICVCFFSLPPHPPPHSLSPPLAE